MMELQAGSGVQEEQSILPAANKKYKDTIFRMLFSDKKNLLSLYNALNGKNYSNCDQLEIVTLENAIYMSMKMIWHLFWTWIYFYGSINLRTILISRCVI